MKTLDELFQNNREWADRIRQLRVRVNADTPADAHRGRDFGAEGNRIIFNEAAIAFMDLKDPIGKKVKLWGEDREIIGVVKDFNFETFHEPIKPLFMYLNQEHSGNIMIIISISGVVHRVKVISR